MKKTILITALISAITLTSQSAHAEASNEKNIGFFSGAIAGGSVAGPLGFIFGGVAGAIMGDKVDKANQLDDAKKELAQLEAEVARLKETAEVTEANNQDFVMETPMMMQGLTLNLMFVTDSATLSEHDEKAIARVSNILKQYPDLKIRLDGYADPRGEESYNQKLSEARAISVQEAFQKNGINSDRLLVVAHGENQATADLEDEDALALERRVSVNFITIESSSLAQNQHY